MGYYDPRRDTLYVLEEEGVDLSTLPRPRIRLAPERV